ncbi:MAG: quinone-dependent dihydroorotate dehydrogenase [Flavobacteriales bacterium]|nr:quinone-dependent dihydroorotate dehydrogenase [Flavobacteriales bacterium]
MYALLRPLLFILPPERAHRLTFFLLGIAARIPGMIRLIGGGPPPKSAVVDLMGLHFPSPVGLAAGMDKDARHVDALSCLGFGFIEVGTLTPRPQVGNPPPRLFRLPKDRALINRMGFNNGGVDAAAERLRARRPGVIVGGNIGKNKDTPNEQAAADYLVCFDALHDVVDYFVVNVSSPNTPGLRELQEKEPLLDLLKQLRGRSTAKAHSATPKPILLKIAPDLTDAQVDDVCDVVKSSGIAGVIATNTTIARQGLRTSAKAVEAMGPGGLSGPPVRARSTEVIRMLRDRLPRPLVIIGVGGVDSAESAMEKLRAGADLVQVYTGLIYAGPQLPARINRAFAENRRLG